MRLRCLKMFHKSVGEPEMVLGYEELMINRLV